MATILVCDDIPAVRRMAGRFLERAGHVVHEAANGDQVLGFVRAKPVDVILLDMVMPTRDGLDTLSALADAECPARVVAMTGGEQEMIDEALERGAVGAVRKPLHFEDLVETVARAIEAAPSREG